MTIITLSYQADRNKEIGEHFRAYEFASTQGAKLYSDVIKYAPETIDILVRLRHRLDALGFGCTATLINSGYRTAAHDKAVGGSGSGPHTRGEAADFCIKCKPTADAATTYTLLVGGVRYVSAQFICCVLEDMGAQGIEYISSRSVHTDCRTARWWSYQVTQGGKYVYPTVASFHTHFGIPRSATKLTIPGDINGDGVVDSSDARLALQAEVGLVHLDAEQRAAADVNGDGIVDNSDARLILQREVELR